MWTTKTGFWLESNVNIFITLLKECHFAHLQCNWMNFNIIFEISKRFRKIIHWLLLQYLWIAMTEWSRVIQAIYEPEVSRSLIFSLVFHNQHQFHYLHILLEQSKDFPCWFWCFDNRILPFRHIDNFPTFELLFVSSKCRCYSYTWQCISCLWT